MHRAITTKAEIFILKTFNRCKGITWAILQDAFRMSFLLRPISTE